jgi:glycosyltransferase involved in cell wall biosynthesis
LIYAYVESYAERMTHYATFLGDRVKFLKDQNKSLPMSVHGVDPVGEHPPEKLAQMIRLTDDDIDYVVHWLAPRPPSRRIVFRVTAAAFYRLIGRLSNTPIPADTGDFRLLSPRAVAALRQLRERHRFMKGLFGWVGFNQVAIPYRREARLAGQSNFGFWKLWNFALEGVTSFSTAPLRVATYFGLATAMLAFVFAIWIIFKAALYGDRVAGWPTMMVVILFMGGIQLIALGLIGEYLGRLYDESKQRPLYLVDVWQPGAGGVFSSGQTGAKGGSDADAKSVVGEQGA